MANETTLSPRHRAILILRTAWLTQSANIWAAEASRAAESGLTPDELMHVAEGPGDDWDPFEAVLIGFADQMFRHAAVTDRTWEALAERYDTHNLIDAVMTVGWTTTNAILFNSLGIQPDDGVPAEALMPVDDVGYRVVVPDQEPPLTTPRIEPVEGDGLRVTRTFLQHPAMVEARNINPRYVLDPERSRLTPHDRELLILRMGWNSAARLRVGQARRQRRPRPRPRPEPGLDRAGPRPVGLGRQRARAHRRRQRDVPRLDDLGRDLGRPVGRATTRTR